ncbi:hypothetical protein BJ912DRAFT_1056817 [Pholiota molesta]|nr:hypothetical protein BJ912DRAFT_1056817 [Pholiota molesta]
MPAHRPLIARSSSDHPPLNSRSRHTQPPPSAHSAADHASGDDEFAGRSSPIASRSLLHHTPISSPSVPRVQGPVSHSYRYRRLGDTLPYRRISTATYFNTPSRSPVSPFAAYAWGSQAAMISSPEFAPFTTSLPDLLLYRSKVPNSMSDWTLRPLDEIDAVAVSSLFDRHSFRLGLDDQRVDSFPVSRITFRCGSQAAMISSPEFAPFTTPLPDMPFYHSESAQFHERLDVTTKLTYGFFDIPRDAAADPVIIRQPEPIVKVDVHRRAHRHPLGVSIENMDGERGYATSDLFIPHPTVPGFWKIVGRKDDVIIYTSREKTVPAPMENIISNSPYVMGVVMFGSEHDQPGVLIELKGPYAIDTSIEADVIQARNLVWSIVEEANRVAPAFSKVFKELILIADASRPLPRAGKGVVMRKAALSAYHDEIEALYASIESAAGAEAVPPPPAWDKEQTEKWIKEQMEDVLPDLTFNITGDLFEQGMDSLGATILRRRTVGALQSDKDTAKAAEFVTQNPSTTTRPSRASPASSSPPSSTPRASRPPPTAPRWSRR